MDRISRIVRNAAAVLTVVACTAAYPARAAGIGTDELLAAELLGAAADPPGLVTGTEILAPSPEMRAFVKANVNPMATPVFRLQQLIDAIMGKASFGLEYEETTRTAAETFRLHRGNCMSFSSMFVALARSAGLTVEFQEVDIPPDWSMGEGLFVLNRHINVRVNLGAGGVHVVDFNIGDFRSTYEVRPVSDRRAYAHFFNNLGVEAMQDGEVVTAVAFLRSAITQGDGEFSPAWTNLGTLYRRAGHLAHAEAAYLEALEADRQDEVAMSNLVALYEMLGEPGKAEEYRKRAEEHRLENPYYRFALARKAFFAREWDTAIEHLRQATRRERSEDQFYFLLGMSYLMKGDEKEARRWLAKAEAVAADDRDKKRYSTKIETLMSAADSVD
ncbi:MAG: tetratricopeptide repeat protein [Thermoanaerobaculales bacterium]|nr:tetratricopeptide repeat protein [Thermoanaerobaculales bacterium]